MTVESITRRRATQGLVAAAAAAAMSSRAFGQGSKKLEDQMTWAMYGGTYETVIRKFWVPAFEKATGVKVRLVVGTALGNLAKIQASKNNPEIDVFYANETTHVVGREQGLFDKIDMESVPNLKNVFKIGRDPSDIGVAHHVSVLALQYNTKEFEKAGIPEPTSWDSLADPRLKGRVAVFNFGNGYSQTMLPALALMKGGNERNIRPAVDWLKKLRAMGNLVSFPGTSAELDNTLLQGSIWIAPHGSQRALMLQNQGAPVKFTVPKNGGIFFPNYQDVVKNCKSPNAARAFINYLLSPEAQVLAAEHLYSAPVIPNVKMSESLADQLVYDEQKMARLIRVDQMVANAELDRWNDIWNREIERA